MYLAGRADGSWQQLLFPMPSMVLDHKCVQAAAAAAAAAREGVTVGGGGGEAKRAQLEHPASDERKPSQAKQKQK